MYILYCAVQINTNFSNKREWRDSESQRDESEKEGKREDIVYIKYIKISKYCAYNIVQIKLRRRRNSRRTQRQYRIDNKSTFFHRKSSGTQL